MVHRSICYNFLKIILERFLHCFFFIFYFIISLFLSLQSVCIGRTVAMALVQGLPVPSDHPQSSVDIQQCHPVSHSPTTGTMGSVSSLISGRTYQERHCRAVSDFSARLRKPLPATSCFRQQEGTLRRASSQEELLDNQPPLPIKNKPTTLMTAGNGNYGYMSDEVVGDWNDNHVKVGSPCSDTEETQDSRGTVNSTNIGGPPPKLIPVSGKLEKVSYSLFYLELLHCKRLLVCPSEMDIHIIPKI